MSVRPDPVIPETRRRRASTTEKSERILKMSRSLTLTRSVLAGTLAEATPNQLDFIERWFTAELDSRERSKRLRVYGQINVYGVTTKSERHKRSYWTRTADGNGIGGRKAPVPYGS